MFRLSQSGNNQPLMVDKLAQTMQRAVSKLFTTKSFISNQDNACMYVGVCARTERHAVDGSYYVVIAKGDGLANSVSVTV